MRLHLTLTPNADPVPFKHLEALTGTLHTWLGAGNDLHDRTSLYSFGWLRDPKGRPDVRQGQLHFPRGARWFLSFHETDAARTCLNGILHDPTALSGMRVAEVKEQATPAFGGAYRFKVDAPVLARRDREGGGKDYLLWDDPAADEALTRVLRWKLQQAGFDGEHLHARMAFDRSYTGAKAKVGHLKGIKHKGSVCPVMVMGTPEAVQFAWHVGAGALTGSGFGALV